MSDSSLNPKGPLMTWKNGLPTPERPRKWTPTEVWSTIGGVAAVIIIALAFYYGFRL